MSLLPHCFTKELISGSFLPCALARQIRSAVHRLGQRLLQWTRPTRHSLLGGLLTDLPRTKSELLAENALLRQHRIILRRQVQRPAGTRTDRMLLVILARAARHWKQALLIGQPDTLLGWQRQLFRWHWRRRSKPASRTPNIPAETIAWIHSMALNNRLWGAERIRGELLKLGIHVWETHHPNIQETGARTTFFSEVVDLLAQPRAGALGLRLLGGDRPLLPLALCLLHR